MVNGYYHVIWVIEFEPAQKQFILLTNMIFILYNQPVLASRGHYYEISLFNSSAPFLHVFSQCQ